MKECSHTRTTFTCRQSSLFSNKFNETKGYLSSQGNVNGWLNEHAMQLAAQATSKMLLMMIPYNVSTSDSPSTTIALESASKRLMMTMKHDEWWPIKVRR